MNQLEKKWEQNRTNGIYIDAWKWPPTDSTKRRKSAVSAISQLVKKLSPLALNTPSQKKTISSPPTVVTASHICVAALSNPSSANCSDAVTVLRTAREALCTCLLRVSMVETV